MTLEESEKIWESQKPFPGSQVNIEGVIASHQFRFKRRMCFYGFMCLVGLIGGCVVFQGSYWKHDEGMLIAVLRSLSVFVLVPIQLFALKTEWSAKKERSRSACTQLEFLHHIVADLEAYLRKPKWWLLILISCLLLLSLVVVKWLDVRSGGDSVGESIGVLTFAVLGILLVFVFTHHYNTWILTPRHTYYKQLLKSYLEQ